VSPAFFLRAKKALVAQRQYSVPEPYVARAPAMV